VRHLTFSVPGAQTLRAAFGVHADVICFDDPLCVGPIERTTAPGRARWIAEHLYDLHAGEAERQQQAWEAACETSMELVIWMSSRSALEACGVLAVLHARDGAAASRIDVAETAQGYSAFGSVTPAALIRMSLFDVRRSFSDCDIARGMAEWEVLRREDAPVRVVDRSGLHSAQLDVFDQTILELIGADWTSCSWVVGKAELELSRDNYRPVIDSFLTSRIRAMCVGGAVIVSDNGREIRRA